MTTPNFKHLPAEAAAIAAEQGWNDESLIIHLVGFIRDNVPSSDKALDLYFGAMAAEENEEAEV